ncbi:MAG TPA: aminotransferase class IV, partial [Geminicoccaceae bacterium]
MTHGTHDALHDPRNAEVLIYLNGELVPRDQAKVSVFDAGFMLGDGVWEGLRLHNGRFAFLAEHLDRLFEGAKALDLDIGMDEEALEAELYRTARANGMSSGVHARLMVTRGPKATPFQDPRLSRSGPTIVIIPEHKVANPETFERGIRLFTAHVHRGPPRRPGSQAQLALQAQLHPRHDPGDQGRLRRGADARSARLRRDLQL